MFLKILFTWKFSDLSKISNLLQIFQQNSGPNARQRFPFNDGHSRWSQGRFGAQLESAGRICSGIWDFTCHALGFKYLFYFNWDFTYIQKIPYIPRFSVEAFRHSEPLPGRFPTWRIDGADWRHGIRKNDIPLRIFAGSVRAGGEI